MAKAICQRRSISLQTTLVRIRKRLREEFSTFFKEITVTGQVRDEQTGEIYYRFERASSMANRPYRCIATLIGGMGPTLAALTAEKMLTRWRPATIVLPGIAASLHRDARLGDIVVADQVDSYLENASAKPAVSQEQYQLSLSGEVYRTSNRVLKEVQNFAFTSRDIFHAWQEQSTDEQVRLGGHGSELISAGLLRQKAAMLDGHIASGPIVGSARSFVNWIKERDRRCFALEMESAGVMAAAYHQASTHKCETLIIRAISDYADENKSRLDTMHDAEGVLREYAMLNAIHLLWGLLDAGLLLQTIM
jgi:nucleoside phosphorylase